MAVGRWLIWGVSVIIGQGWAQQLPTVGQSAPKLEIGAIEQGSVEPPRATVLEFWATWCPACREAIPHLNELAEQFKGRPIDFLSLTSESEERVKAFLKTHVMRGVVALDPGDKMFHSFNAGLGLPTTVLITASGKIAAITNEPVRITPVTLEDLISDRPVDLSLLGPRRLIEPDPKINDTDALVRMVITPVFQRSAVSRTDDQYESNGSTLPELLAFAYDISPFRLVIPVPLQQQIYAVQAWVPRGHAEQLKPLMQSALTAAAGIQVKREERVVDVLVMQGLLGNLRESHGDRPVLGHASASTGHLSGDGVDLDTLREQVETVVGKHVIIECPARVKVEYELSWDVAKPGSFEAALRDQLGLELKSEQRKMEVLVVEARLGAAGN
jgi:uncharacterized protein (TIGR03435 family)